MPDTGAEAERATRPRTEESAVHAEADGALHIEIRDPGPELRMRETRRDIVRARLAYASLGLFLVALIMGFVGLLSGQETWERTKDFLQIIVPVITLLIGGTAGHYFGRAL